MLLFSNCPDDNDHYRNKLNFKKNSNMEINSSIHLEELSYEDQVATSGGWGGGGSLGYSYRAAAHEMGDFVRGIYHGLRSMWEK